MAKFFIGLVMLTFSVSALALFAWWLWQDTPGYRAWQQRRLQNKKARSSE